MSNIENIKVLSCEEIDGTVCLDVVKEDLKEMIELAKRMIDFCYKNGALGLAAPQAGVFKKMFVYLKYDSSYQVVFNSRYFPKGKKIFVIETCLSCPEEKYLVERFKEIRVVFETVDKNGEFVRVNNLLSGQRGIIFSHETDHINGKSIKTTGKSIGKNDS